MSDVHVDRPKSLAFVDLALLRFSWRDVVFFKSVQKTAFRRSVWQMTVPLHKLSAGTTDEWGTHRWVSGTRGCKIKIVMYLLVKVGRLWLRPCFPPSIVSLLFYVRSHNVSRRPYSSACVHSATLGSTRYGSIRYGSIRLYTAPATALPWEGGGAFINNISLFFFHPLLSNFRR